MFVLKTFYSKFPPLRALSRPAQSSWLTLPTKHMYIYKTNCASALSFAGNSGRLTWVRHSSRKSSATHCYHWVYAVFPCVQTMVWLPVSGIWNVRTDVDACDCTRGQYGQVTERVCTGSWLWEKDPLTHRDSNPRQHCAWFFSRTGSTHWAIPAPTRESQVSHI